MLVEHLKENYFFAVIRGKDKEDAKNIARYAIKGGIYNIEITFSTPKADEVIKELIEEFKDEKSNRRSWNCNEFRTCIFSQKCWG